MTCVTPKNNPEQEIVLVLQQITIKPGISKKEARAGRVIVKSNNVHYHENLGYPSKKWWGSHCPSTPLSSNLISLLPNIISGITGANSRYLRKNAKIWSSFGSTIYLSNDPSWTHLGALFGNHSHGRTSNISSSNTADLHVKFVAHLDSFLFLE